uniref:Uncharacterized protein n=1 Tax=viral metagenome TaxID=1070528 RepID=A0A6H1ZIP0_9ZZZZ
MSEYYLVGEYNSVPVYYSTKQGIMLGSRMDELAEPTAIQNLEIIRDLGGMSNIERMVNNYERTERLEVKHGRKRRPA